MKAPDRKLLRALQSPFPLSVSKVANLHLRIQEEAASQGPSYRYGNWVLQAGASGRGKMGGGPHGPGLRLQLCVQIASLTQDFCWVTESLWASVYSLRTTESPQELSEEYARCQCRRLSTRTCEFVSFMAKEPLQMQSSPAL